VKDAGGLTLMTIICAKVKCHLPTCLLIQ